MCIRNRIRVMSFFFLFTICAMITLPLGVSVAHAQDVRIPTTRHGLYIYDDEDVLSKEKESELNDLLVNLERQTTIEFAVVTTNSFNGNSIEEYANTLFNKLGIGKKDKDNGILLLISAKEGHGRLEIGYGLEDVLTDSKCGSILDKFYVPYREKSEHSDSVYYTVKGVLSVLGDKYSIQLTDNQGEMMKSIDEDDNIGTYMIIIAAIILVIMIARSYSRSRRSYYRSSYSDYDYGGSSSSSDGFSSVGFFDSGSSDSGSSSSDGGSSDGGGFDGGSSGGGGASR